MALTVGQLVATMDVDDTQFVRGLTSAELAMRGFSRDADGRLRDTQGRFVSTSAAAHRMGTEVHNSTDHASAGLRDLHDRADRGSGALTHLSGAARGLAGGLGGAVAGMAPMLAQLGSIVPLAAAVATTLADIAPAASVAATGILTVVTATAAFKLATHGIGDAVKAAFDPGTKPGELKAALDGLAPPARQFVLALRAMRPELKALQQDVQGEVFAGLGKQISALGATLLPTLRTQLGSTGMVLNMMASQALDTATKLSKGGVFGKALDAANNSLYDLAGIPALVIQAFGQLAAAAGPTLNRMTAGISGAVDSLSTKLNTAFANGGITRAIDNAVGILKQLGDVARNIGTVIGGVFKAAQANGGNLLGTLGAVTAALAAAVNTPAVQQGLSAMFDLFGTLSKLLGSSLGPIISQVAAAFGQIAPVITSVLNSLGDATPVVALLLTKFNPLLGILALLAPVMGDLVGPIGQIIRGLTPLIDAIGVFAGQLGKALVPIVKGLAPVIAAAAGAVGALLTALAPLLPVIGGLIGDLLPVFVPFLKAMGTIFGKLADPVKQIATALGKALQPVIKGLSDVVGDLVAQYLASFMDILGDLLPLIPTLTPLLIQLGVSYGQVLEAVAPLLPQLLSLVAVFVTQLLPAILPLVPPLAALATMLLILATDVITGVVVPVFKGLITFMGGLMKAFQPAIDAVKWLTTGIASLFEWLSDHLVGHSVIPDMVRSIVGWFAGLPGKAIAALGNIAAQLGQVMVDATNRMINAVRVGLGAVVSWMRDLPGRAKDALGDIGNLLYKSGQALLDGFARGIKSMGGIVKSAAGSVLGGVKNLFPNSPAKEGPFSGSGWTYHSGIAVARDWAGGITSQESHVKRAVSALMGGAQGALMPGGGASVLGVAGGGAGVVAAAGGPQQVVVKFDVSGADEDMKRLIRRMVKTSGGGPNSVQHAFG